MINQQLLLHSVLLFLFSSNFEVETNIVRSTGVVIKENSQTNENCIDTQSNEFPDFVENSRMFVDKSMLIASFLRYPSPVVLVTCPRGWGKTINVNMLKSYLQMKVDLLGNRVSALRGLLKTYRLFRYGEMVITTGIVEKLKPPLLIAGHKNMMNDHFGRHCVIFINFKKAAAHNYPDMESKLKVLFSSIYKEHEYILRVLKRNVTNSNIAAHEKDEMVAKLYIFEKMLYSVDVNLEEIETSLLFLSQILYQHFNRKVFILVDDYDYLVNVALTSDTFDREDEEKVIKFFDGLFRNTFRDNQYLKRGFLVGNFGIAKRCLHGTADFIEEHFYFNSPFTKYFGFNREDAELLFRNCKLTPEFSAIAHSWFDGYKLQSCSDERFYNSWSVTTFLKSGSIEPRWTESASMNVMQKLIEISSDVRLEVLLMLGGMKILSNLCGDELKAEHISLLFKKNPHQHSEVDFSWCLTFFRAYLPVGGFVTLSSPSVYLGHTAKSNVSLVGIANREIAALLATQLLSFYSRVYAVARKVLLRASADMNDFIFNNDLTSSLLELAMERHISQLSSFKTIAKVFKENGIPNEYHDSQHSLLTIILLQIQCSSKFETVVKYCKKLKDAIMVCNNKKKRGAVLKLTYDERTSKNSLSWLKQCNKTAFIGFSINTIKYIAINISPAHKKVQIHSIIEDVSL